MQEKDQQTHWGIKVRISEYLKQCKDTHQSLDTGESLLLMTPHLQTEVHQTRGNVQQSQPTITQFHKNARYSLSDQLQTNKYQKSKEFVGGKNGYSDRIAKLKYQLLRKKPLKTVYNSKKRRNSEFVCENEIIERKNSQKDLRKDRKVTNTPTETTDRAPLTQSQVQQSKYAQQLIKIIQINLKDQEKAHIKSMFTILDFFRSD